MVEVGAVVEVEAKAVMMVVANRGLELMVAAAKVCGYQAPKDPAKASSPTDG